MTPYQYIRQIQIRTTRKVNDLFAGAYKSAFKGKGLEFAEVRDYQPGDEIRHIDWNVTARMHHPYVKSFVEERELTVFLVIDISASSLFGSGKRLKSEIIAEIAAVLAFSAIKNYDKVGLILFSNEIELFLKPKKGLRHVMRVIREILFFKPKHKGTDLQKALAFLGRVQRRHAICFFISDFMGNQSDHEASILAKRHELIFVQVYDKLEEKFPELGLTYVGDLETDQINLIDSSDVEFKRHFNSVTLERNHALKRLSNKIGAGLISISCQESYSNALRKFFKLRGKRH